MLYEQQNVIEAVNYGLLPGGVLNAIEIALLEKNEQGKAPSFHINVSASGEIVDVLDDAPLDPMVAISEEVIRCQRLRGGTRSSVDVSATLIDFSEVRVEPWHAETFDGAYVSATKASTETLSGTIPTKGSRTKDLMMALIEAAVADEDFSNVDTLTIVEHEPESLIHLPNGAFHRSPRSYRPTPGLRLLVNSVVLPMMMFDPYRHLPKIKR